MRHSSWTLFLVPLTLPLALLLLPGSMNSTDRSGPAAGTGYEVIQELSSSNQEPMELLQGSAEGGSGENSEAFFKD